MCFSPNSLPFGEVNTSRSTYWTSLSHLSVLPTFGAPIYISSFIGYSIASHVLFVAPASFGSGVNFMDTPAVLKRV